VTWCLAVVLLVCGCVRTVQPYPSTWRGLHADSCAAILGAYENLGEGGTGKRGEALFTLLVAVYDHEKPRRSGDRAPGVVTISMPEPGVLEARTGTLSQRFLAQSHEFACTDGVLEFARTGATGSNMGGWLGSSVIRVAKDEDGWLVVSRDESGFALLGYVIPVYMAFLTWTRFQPATAARVEEASRERAVGGDAVDVLAVTRPAIRRTVNGFAEFEMTATVRYALHSADTASLQVSAVLFASAGCASGDHTITYPGRLLSITRGEATRLVPVIWRIKPDAPRAPDLERSYVTVRSALWSDTAEHRPELIRSFRHPRDYCFALRAADSGRPDG
jgi:hypothetical protein